MSKLRIVILFSISFGLFLSFLWWKTPKKDEISFQSLQKGDLIFVNSGESPIDKAITEIGRGYGYPINHIAIYQGASMFLEAIPPQGVVETSLDDFIKKYTNPKTHKMEISIASLKDKTYIPLFIQKARQYLHRPYNSNFSQTTNRFYCSQLVLQALREAQYPGTPADTPMTFKDQNGHFIPAFIQLYKNKNNIPEGVLGSHPANIFLQANLAIKFDYLRSPHHEGFKLINKI